MRISDWSSDVCSSDLAGKIKRSWRCDRRPHHPSADRKPEETRIEQIMDCIGGVGLEPLPVRIVHRAGNDQPPRNTADRQQKHRQPRRAVDLIGVELVAPHRHAAGVPSPAQLEEHEKSEEHTSELQSLMRISYAVFCLKKKK